MKDVYDMLRKLQAKHEAAGALLRDLERSIVLKQLVPEAFSRKFINGEYVTPPVTTRWESNPAARTLVLNVYSLDTCITRIDHKDVPEVLKYNMPKERWMRYASWGKK